ncbi:hypothetical protein [Nonomuraea sp. NPDC005650]|uniref:hypothetical protein n=1 Tax=Nonomuraea sp. NPDC005650 TaxID=3157045 RepID=UPI0033BEE9E7
MRRGTRFWFVGSHRDWEAERRRQERAAEQARQKRERERKAQGQQRLQAEAAARDAEAADRTRQVEARVEELEALLRSSLTRNPRIRFAALRRKPEVPLLDLGPLANPLAAPVWQPPPSPGWLQRKFGGEQRYETALRQAEAEHQYRETQRQKEVVERRRAHQARVSEAERAAAEHNALVDAIGAGLRVGGRHAVSDYMDMVLRASPYPEGFPTGRKTGYVPESSLLAVEWCLPPPEIVPENKLFRHMMGTGRPALSGVQCPEPDLDEPPRAAGSSST